MTTLVFETHSITTDNERGVATGWQPGELSDAGRALAVELGVRRRNDAIALTFTSDLARAVETRAPPSTARQCRSCTIGAYVSATTAAVPECR